MTAFERDWDNDLRLPATFVADIRFSTGGLVRPYDPGASALDATSLAAGRPLSITIVGSAGGRVLVDGVPVETNVPHAIQLARLGPNDFIEIQYRNLADRWTKQRIRTLPSDFPAFTIESTAPAAGNVFLGVFSFTKLTLPTYAMLLDERGAPLFYRRTSSPPLDFKWHDLSNGRTRYSYIADGVVIVMNESFEIVSQLALLPTAKHGPLPAEVHDFLLLDDDHYILSAYATELAAGLPPELAGGNPAPFVQAEVLQEVQAGSVVFEWDSTEHPELYARSTDGNNFAQSSFSNPADYVHFNSIQIDPANGNWLISLRHQDAILEVDRATGAIAWTLGGLGDDFGLSPAQVFSHQHFARFQPGGELLFFDNGNASGATRIVEIGLDRDTRTVTSFSALETGRYSFAMGSVQKLQDSRYFIGWGAHPGDGKPDVTEIDRQTGEVYFSLTFAEAYYSYRAVKRLAP
jgi:hypothetical protein